MPLSRAARKRLGGLVEHAERTVRDMIFERGGSAGNVRIIMQVEKCQRNLDAFYSLSSDTAEFLHEVYEGETEGCRDTVVLVFKSKFLTLVVNEDDDTLSISCENIAAFDKRGLRQKNRSGTWRRFIGKAFGWGWVTVNQQGYCDGALLSFGGITPNVCLEVAASAIEISNSIRFHQAVSRSAK